MSPSTILLYRSATRQAANRVLAGKADGAISAYDQLGVMQRTLSTGIGGSKLEQISLHSPGEIATPVPEARSVAAHSKNGFFDAVAPALHT